MSSSDSDSDNGKKKMGAATAPPPPYAPGPSYPQPMPQQYQQPYPAPPMGAVGVQQQGYYVNKNGQQVFVTQVTTTKQQQSTMEGLRSGIPIMPMSLAIFCCCINFILPGMGTITASFAVFCCANPGQSGGDKFGCFCLNFWVGWLQLFTIWIFFLGWIWSIMWGMAFIAVSAEFYENTRPVVQTTTITETPVTYPVSVAAASTTTYHTH